MNEHVIRQIETAIASIEKIPNLNVEFTIGHAMGLLIAFRFANLIKFEEYKNYYFRINKLQNKLVDIYKKTGRHNCVLLEDVIQ